MIKLRKHLGLIVLGILVVAEMTCKIFFGIANALVPIQQGTIGFGLDINEGELSIGSSGNVYLNLGSGDVSSEIMTILGEFGADNFLLKDQKGSEFGYYVSLELTDMVGVNSESHVIPKESISIKSSGLHTIEGTSSEEAGVNLLLSNTGYVQIGDTPITYIGRDTVIGAPGNLGLYGDNLKMKIDVPAFTLPDSYVGTIIYTLYDLGNKERPSLNLGVTNIMYGETEILDINVPADLENPVIIKLDGEVVGEIPAGSGETKYNLSNIGLGEHTVQLVYSGDYEYYPNTSTARFSVSEKMKTIINMDVSNILTGETEEISARMNATGTVLMKLNGEVLGEVETTDGEISYSITGLEMGVYTLEIEYAGNSRYYSGSSSASFVVSEYSGTQIEIEYDNTYVGDLAIITINHLFDYEAGGLVELTCGNNNYTGMMEGGKLVFEIENLSAGTYKCIASYYGTTSEPIYLNVGKVTPDISLEDITVDGDAVDIEITVPIDAMGFVLMYVDGEGYFLSITDGRAGLALYDLGGGTHYIEATFPGDDKYESSITTGSFQIEDVPCNIDIRVDNITYGEKAIVQVTGPSDATGVVELHIEGRTFTGELYNGTYTFIVPDLNRGSKPIDVIYYGNDKYSSCSNSTIMEVSRISLSSGDMHIIDKGSGTIAVTLPKDAENRITGTIIGDNKTFQATVENGIAELTFTGVTPGIHTVSITYIGDGHYRGITKTGTVVIPKYESTLSLDYDNINVGDTAVFTVNFSEEPEGEVTVNCGSGDYTGGIVGGKAIIEVDDLPAGIYNCVAIYPGDGVYGPATDSISFEVTKVTPDIWIEIEADEGDLIIDMSGPEDAEGYLLLGIDYCYWDYYEYVLTFTDGRAQMFLPVADLYGTGTHNVYVKYLGDDKYNPSDGFYAKNHGDNNYIYIPNGSGFEFEFTGGVGGLIETEMSVETDGQIGVGDTAVIRVELSEWEAEGEITVNCGNGDYTGEIVGGSAVFEIDDLPAGIYNCIATYSGDGVYGPTTARSSLEVNKNPVDMRFYGNQVPDVDIGDEINVTVQLAEDASGFVLMDIVDGSGTILENHYSEITNGIAYYQFSDKPSGNYTANAYYLGDEKYLPQSISTGFSISMMESFIIASVGNITAGEYAIVRVTVPQDAVGTVTVTIGDEFEGTQSLSNGDARFSIPNLTPGTKTLTARYNGSDIYATSTYTTTFNVQGTRAPQMRMLLSESETEYGDDYENVEYNGEIYDYDYGETIELSGFIDTVGSVTLYIDGDEYDTVNITNGQIDFEIPYLEAGEYELTLVFNGNNTYQTGSQTISIKVNEIDPELSMEISSGFTYGETKYLTISGNVTGTIDLKLDGVVIATGLTLENGYGSVSLASAHWQVPSFEGVSVIELQNVPAGEHVVEAIFNGNNNYKTGSVSQTIVVDKVDTILDMEVYNPEYTREQYPELSGNYFTVHLSVDSSFATGVYSLTVSGSEKMIYTGELISGAADIFVEAIDGGWIFTPNYLGDSNHNSSYTGQIVAVVSSGGENVIIGLKRSIMLGVDIPNTVYVGTSFVITVNTYLYEYDTVLNQAIFGEQLYDIDGYIRLEIDGREYDANLVSGSAQFFMSGLSNGGKTLIAKYPGSYFYGAQITSAQFQVSKIQSEIRASGKDITVGKDETITITVPEGATGRCSVVVAGVGYYGTVVNGKAKVIIPELPAGQYTVTVTYEGDDKYLPSSTTTSFKVKGGTSGNISYSNPLINHPLLALNQN